MSEDVNNAGEELDNIIILNDEEGNEVQMTESIEEGTHENVNELINDKNFELKEESFEDAGFRETDVQGIDDDSSISAD